MKKTAWDKKFECLVQFRVKFPHRWPTGKEEFPQGNKLGSWINIQRAAARRGMIQFYRLKMLEKIDFPISPFEDRWNYQYCLLKQFILLKDRLPRKRELFPEGNMLGVWCQTQRDSFRSDSLQKEKVALLNNLNFEWSPMAILWDQQLENLTVFRALFSDRWPAQREEYPRGNKLGQWCQTQRKMYKNNILSAVRKRKLDHINFFDHLNAKKTQH